MGTKKKPAPRPAPPLRVKNTTADVRKHLTSGEVEQLIRTARATGRHGHRDATMILIAYRHGLRVSELVGLRWDQIDFEQRVLHVRRCKRGSPSTHPLTRTELGALRKLATSAERKGPVFLSERKGAMSERTFFDVIQRAGKKAGIEFSVHPHMCRHACGYTLANQGRDTRTIQDYLGHRNIQHTVEYTKLASGRFDGFFED